MREHSLKIRLVGLLEHCMIKHCISLFALTGEYGTATSHVKKAINRFTNAFWILPLCFPRSFYVQMDIFTRRNKNRFMFGYLKYLVCQKVFEDVYVPFLPIGHIHENTEQVLSCTDPSPTCTHRCYAFWPSSWGTLHLQRVYGCYLDDECDKDFWSIWKNWLDSRQHAFLLSGLVRSLFSKIRLDHRLQSRSQL